MDQDPDIKKLKKESEDHKIALQAEINGWVRRSKKLALRVVLIGGGFTLAYLLSRHFLSKNNRRSHKKNESETKPSIISEFSHFLLKELSVFLLVLAKEQLLKYLDERESDEQLNSKNT
ncbi:MAG: hypothetical protein AAGF85_01005 [Bacteroidota bacterium]